MRRSVVLGVLMSLAVASMSVAKEALIDVPGTGLRISPPAGASLARVGPVLLDDSGETIVTFMMSEARLNPENSPMWRKVFTREPEQIKGAVSGNLYQRTRAADGGGWDGWMWIVPRGGSVLTITAMYTGKSPEAFARLKGNLLTLQWNEKLIDAETAMGVALKPQGLVLVKGLFGGLSYNRTGVIGAPGVSVLVQPMPVPAAKSSVIFPGNCQPLLAQTFGRAEFKGPEIETLESHGYCEGWSETAGKYMALVRVKSGGLLSVWGNAPPAEFAAALPVFRDAIATLRVVEKAR